MSYCANEAKEYARPTEDMMTARSPSERFWVTLVVCEATVHGAYMHICDSPFTDDARVGA